MKEYKVELANKILNGKAVGNLYGVALYIDGCRRGEWVLKPQESRNVAFFSCRKLSGE